MARLKVVHINRQRMAANIKQGCNLEPVVTARYKNKPGLIRSNELHIVDQDGNILVRVVSDVTKPLSCGARAYIATHLRIVDAKDSSVALD